MSNSICLCHSILSSFCHSFYHAWLTRLATASVSSPFKMAARMFRLLWGVAIQPKPVALALRSVGTIWGYDECLAFVSQCRFHPLRRHYAHTQRKEKVRSFWDNTGVSEAKRPNSSHGPRGELCMRSDSWKMAESGVPFGGWAVDKHHKVLNAIWGSHLGGIPIGRWFDLSLESAWTHVSE